MLTCPYLHGERVGSLEPADLDLPWLHGERVGSLEPADVDLSLSTW